MKNSTKKTIFSGIKPSGELHLGNYLGAISQWVKMQTEYNCLFCVVDYHAITVTQDPKLLTKRTMDIVKTYLAAGLDPKKTTIFRQSDIKEHTELGWILNCTTARMSDLENMTQYKEKATDFELLEKIASKMSDENYIKEAEQRYKERISEEFDKLITDTKDPEERIAREALRRSNSLNIPKEIRDVLIELITHSYNQYRAGQKNISVGLFDYPVLMAADILLYDADLVPVGEDQIQHVELTRDLAKRFNHNFGQTFKIPEAKTLKAGARIMGLDNPLKKMSKSGTSENDCLYLLDEPEKAYKKIMRATTDSGNEIKYDKENKPGVSNLLTIYSLLTDKDIKILEKEYKGKGYGDFKKDLAEIVKSFLTDFQKKWYKINNKIVLNILKDGSKKLQKQATAKLKITKEKIGII